MAGVAELLRVRRPRVAACQAHHGCLGEAEVEPGLYRLLELMAFSIMLELLQLERKHRGVSQPPTLAGQLVAVRPTRPHGTPSTPMLGLKQARVALLFGSPARNPAWAGQHRARPVGGDGWMEGWLNE